jgi:hypothetical protein
VKVQVYRSGATDDVAAPLPRWSLTLNPVSATNDIAYGSA